MRRLFRKDAVLLGPRDVDAHDRPVVFYRDIRNYHGGHLKVWNYFNHVAAAPGFAPYIRFSPNTLWDESNPWAKAGLVEHKKIDPDIYFLAGRDWASVDPGSRPVINLIQGLRHADERLDRSEMLQRHAIRICVSEYVAEAITATGRVNGPVFTIPNAVDVPPIGVGDRDIELLVVAMKDPELGSQLRDAIGANAVVLDTMLPREDFLTHLARAKVTVFLPLHEEGFYLPPLEGMALGTIVVCPDCVGNRSHCVPGETAFRPEFTLDAIVADTKRALELPEAQAEALRAGGERMAHKHAPAEERRSFLDILRRTDELWSDG